MKNCQWCNSQFSSKISYQIYCSSDCRDAATREKIAERYAITRRSRRHGKDRKCKVCKAQLSAYNDDTTCTKCTVTPTDVNRALRDIRNLSNGKE